jgi:type IV secretory pathway protease TraF
VLSRLALVAAAVLVALRAGLVVVQVNGESMVPVLRPGDQAVVLRRRYLRRLRPGHLVVCRYPGPPWPRPPGAAPYLVKRVAAVAGQEMGAVGRAGRVPAGHLVLLGTHEPSFDSRQFGPVPRTAVLGRVLAVLPR